MADGARAQRIEDIVEGTPHVPLEASRTRYACPVRKMWEESHRYIGLRVEIDDALRECPPQPGQYVTMGPPGVEPRFVVVANHPDFEARDDWEFLIDRQTELGAAFDSVEVGTRLQLSAPEGTGYPVDEVRGRRVLCFTTGSGIASMRPALQYWRRHPERAPDQLVLYYGESHPGDFAYREEAREWSRRDGMRIYEACESQPESTRGEFRYVQHAFDHDEPPLEETIVLLSGAPVMKRIVVERLLERGVPLESIATNI